MNRKAFTLIELLVVISIIALLVGILLPALGAARRVAQDIKGASNMRQQMIGVVGYSNDYDGILPPGFDSGTNKYWSLFISDYATKSGLGDADQSEMFQCPSSTFDQGVLHYSLHPVFGYQNGWRASARAAGVPFVYSMDMVKRQSEFIYIMDGIQGKGRVLIDPSNPSVPIEFNAFATAINLDARRIFQGKFLPAIPFFFYKSDAADNDDPIDPGTNEDDDNDVGTADIRWRHAGGNAGNFAFMDGHVEKMAIGEVKKRNVRNELP